MDNYADFNGGYLDFVNFDFWDSLLDHSSEAYTTTFRLIGHLEIVHKSERLSSFNVSALFFLLSRHALEEFSSRIEVEKLIYDIICYIDTGKASWPFKFHPCKL